MKICLINNLYKPFNRGGAERISEIIARGLKQAGHEVFIIATRPAGAPKVIINDEQIKIYQLKSIYYRLGDFPKSFRLFWHLWDMFNFINYFKVKRILKQETCQAVIANNLMGVGFLTTLAVKRLKIKIIQIIHDIQLIHPSGLMRFGEEKLIDKIMARNYAGLMSRLIDSPDIVIFPSRWLMDMYLEKIFFIKSKRIILPNPVETAAEVNFTKVKESNNFKFIFLGQIEEHKGIFLLIEAFKKLKQKYFQAELLIVGNGSKRAEAEALDQDIKFLDWPGDDQVNKLLSQSQALVFPSLVYENCPNAIQRALKAGVPVLAADLGGVPELLSKNAGLLFKPNDLDDLTAKMEWLINNRGNLTPIILAGKEKAALCGVENYIKELESLLK